MATVLERPGSAPWFAQSADAALAALASDAQRGLSEREAARRLARDGPNAIEQRGRRTLAHMVAGQLRSVLIAMLLAAAAVSAALGDWIEAGAIVAIVGLFVGLGALQDLRAERALEALRAMATPVVEVIRGGAVLRCPSEGLVAGDVARLRAGDIVPADCRLLEAAALRVQESALTGEAVPVDKQSEPVLADAPLAERSDMVYRGAFVTAGRATALVVATGMRTELGRIAALVQAEPAVPTLLQRRLDALSRALAVVALVAGAVVMVTGALRAESLDVVLLTGVSLAVAVVPEGLPAVLTLTLALGARRMLRRNALVRRLTAAEGLGSVTVICTDKTGTLTQNRMQVTTVDPWEGVSEQRLLAAAALCNDATHEGPGDPTEYALVAAAAAAGVHKAELEAAHPRVAEIPFDGTRKRMTTVHEPAPAAASAAAASAATAPASAATAPASAAPAAPAPASAAPSPAFASPARFAITKGAPDVVLDRCLLTPSQRAALDRRLVALAEQGIRVLAVASRSADEQQPLDSGLELLGLIGMVDPPRLEAAASVARCRAAGIRVVMITGDHPVTAAAIAAQLGLGVREVVAGPELAALSDAELAARAEAIDVYARVTPEDKLRIVGALQANGEVVAMTGDGVNDAPALRRADIGVAMGSGTDVARDAADLVLLDDDFGTIAVAVEEGRVVFDNVRRFVQFSVAGNVGKVLIVALPPLFGAPLLLVPLQILWLNLLTDGLMSLGMGVERGERDVMRRPPLSARDGVLNAAAWRRIAIVGPLIALLGGLAGIVLWLSSDDETAATTLTFTAVCALQVGQALSARSFSDPIWRTGLRGNPMLIGGIGLALALQLAVVYIPPLQPVFSTAALHAGQLALVAGLGLALALAGDALKRRRAR